MLRWFILFAGIGYLLLLTVFWSLLIAAGRADDAQQRASAPVQTCPVCTSTNVYVDADDVCFCVECRASYPMSNTEPLS